MSRETRRTRSGGRPAPDEAQLEDAPTPQPEREERRLERPVDDPRQLSRDDWKAIVQRAGKQSLEHSITDLAAALAYYSFLAIPAALLTVFGLLGLFAPESTLQTIATKLAGIGPGQANEFLGGAIQRLGGNPGQTIPMTVVGFVLALSAEVNAEVERSRELRLGEPAERELQLPPREEPA